ncbi:MAG: aspartate aminotransferase [Bdellovibrionaceae bacterium]|nr:aspartate aminotransferase [Pseudobdellovibrionaceae bacterium]|tara:strand:- start:29881 stop:31077 length:1197 start_codon:yes stop_codon:yes gene_type:complete
MLSRRAKNIQPSPTLSLAAKAKELKAEGNDVISLTVGEPDWNTFPEVVDVAIESMKSGNTKYVPPVGIPALRKAIAEDYNTKFSTNYSDVNVSVSTGAKFILFAAFQAVIDPGDEVIIPSPFWVSYPEMVTLAEGVPVVVKCDKESRFKMTPQLLESSITEKTKMVLLNSPSNPTGMVYSQSELKALAEVLKKHPNILVLSDDIYNLLVFNERGLAPHLLEACPELESRTICVNGASKAYSMTGWRVGWALGPKEVIKAMGSYQSQSVSCASGFSQEASLYALKNTEDKVRASVEVLKQRKQKLSDKLNAIDGIEVEEPEGAFYIWLNVLGIQGKSYKGKKLESSSDVAKQLLDDEMVATVPGDAFGLDGYLRLSYALSEERGLEACDRIANFCSQLS